MSAQPMPMNRPRPFRDAAFINALLALAFIPLVLLRHHPVLEAPLFLPAFWLSAAALVAVWLLGERATVSPGEQIPSCPCNRLRLAAVAATGAALFFVVYFLPMLDHFWGGGDEILCLYPKFRAVWSPAFEEMSRPTWGLGPLMGSLLTPDRVDGFVWAASAVYLLNGLLLAAIVRHMLPGEPAIAVAAGVLLICHRGDVSRFLVLWTGVWYWTSLTLLLLGAWLFLRSARSGNRFALMASCISMGTSLLGSEAGFTLAAFAPVLLYISGVRGGRLLVWSAAWYGTIAVLAVRFLQYFLTKTDSYQSQQTTGVLKNPELLLQNLSIQTKPFWKWFSNFAAIGTYWWAAAAAAALAALAVLLAGPATIERRAKRYVVGGLLAAVIAAAGIAPFIHLDGPFRTQFHTAPAQAAMIAVIVGGASRFLCRSGSLVGLAVGVGLLAGAAAVGNRKFQSNADNSVSFVRTVHVLRQIHSATPDTAPETLIVVLPEGGALDAVGACQKLALFTNHLSNSMMVTYEPDASLGLKIVTFLPDRVKVWDAGVAYPYERVILFRVASDGAVSLLRQFPDDLGLVDPRAVRYDPLPLLNPGAIRDLPYIRYPVWVKPPRDVVEVESGVNFGPGWSAMQNEGERLFRNAEPGAELLINPEGQASRTLVLEVEPVGVAGATPCSLEIRDRDDKLLVRAPLRGRERLALTIHTDPARTQLVSLWAGPEGQSLSIASALDLRVYAPSGAARPPVSDLRLEIAYGGLRLGQNWHQVERSRGETFRWMNTGAELLVQKPGARALILDVDGGPGLAGGSGVLRLVGPQGRTLHEAPIARGDRREFRWELAPDLPVGTTLRLDVMGGGKPSAGDSRICNVRFYRCELRR